MVAMAKNGPRKRNVGHEISRATIVASVAAGKIPSHGVRPRSRYILATE
jgi:hypothetical protein